ncbi:uncharacterized protein M421DRAFT_97764 [Didymella exigua CBS 183.55]|uniref:Uncharacterized protein n=1 Tax=Didymella exigua CBS 183.55 TaxID=1150837 RepID=A0A6A5S256_9PLEO|nr:uncharacterized protein M421DRAFT_97764 [Didymella exigua CBS 183.55]KAF1933690.1 hypothetical protein M421DRAFT_97764 [Didymella exigua CBS 183.55]
MEFSHGAYTIGWICALPKEMTAAIAMLDTEHETLPQSVSDTNNYTLGSIGPFNIVIVCLPSGEIGSHPASAVAARMLANFPALKMGLMVGIGGGVPSKDQDIRLGDIVVSVPTNGFGGVVQHDMGKNTKDKGWIRTGSLNGPPLVLRTTISKLISLHQIRGHEIETYLSEMIKRYPDLSPRFCRPKDDTDILYQPEPADPHAFQSWEEILRPRRHPREAVRIHHGLIASGNQVIKSGRLRDEISARLGGVLCFEMEAAGLMNELPCVVIRGICDYADAHKNKEWQEYAAAVAAAYAKELIFALPTVVEGEQWIVPFPKNDKFVGREQELSTLHRWSNSDVLRPNMALYGLGGVGKTQIALEFAYRTKAQKREASVFWVPANDHLAFEQAYKQIGTALRIPGIEAHGADVKQLVKDALCNDQRLHPWLMIVDNADDINIVFQKSTDDALSNPALIDYVPSSPLGCVLLTTRNRRIAVRQAHENIIFLEMMSPDDAEQLLKKSLVQEKTVRRPNATKELLTLLGYLPLAITQAVSYINENDTEIDDYIELYQGSETEKIEVLSEEFETHGRYQTIKNSIPSRKQGLEAIGALKAYSFVRKRDNIAVFDMHPLVHLATRHWLRTEVKLELWISRVTDLLEELLPDGAFKDRATWTAYLHHTEYLLTSSEPVKDDLRRVILAEKMAKCLYSNGEYKDACSSYSRALDLRLQVSGKENRESLMSRFGMAEALNHQGDYRQAEKRHREILELRKDVLGPKHPDAMYDDGRYAEAEEMHRNALSLQIEVLHPEHPNVLTTTGYLAQTLAQQGRHQEAEDMHRNLLETRLRVQGEENPATLATMSCLGVAQENLGQFAKAEETHRRVLALRVKMLGDRHPHTAITKKWLAVTLLHQAKFEEAKTMNQEALRLQTELLGPKHYNTILTLGNSGDIYFSQGQFSRAEQIFRQALYLQMEVLGPDHPETSQAITKLRNALLSQGKDEEAQELIEKGSTALHKSAEPQHVTWDI